MILFIVVYLGVNFLGDILVNNVKVFNKFVSDSNSTNNFKVKIVEFIITNVVTVFINIFLKTQKKVKSVRKLYYKLEHGLYHYLMDKKMFKTVRNFIFNDFKYNHLNSVNNFLWKNINKKSFFFFLGESNTGKTSTIYKLYDYIGKSKNTLNEYIALNNNGIYIDCFSEDELITDFIGKYNNCYYEDKYIFLDNLEQLSRENLFKLYSNVFSEINNDLENMKCKMLVAICNMYRSSNMILNYINSKLESRYKKEFTQKIKFEKRQYVESYEVENYILSVNESAVNNDLINRILNMHYNNNFRKEFMCFMCILVISKYKQIFSAHELAKLAYRYKIYGPYKYIRILKKNGIVKQFCLDNRLLYFNNGVSDYYFSKLKENSFLLKQYHNILNIYYKMSKRNPVLNWNILINMDYEYLKEKYDISIFYESIIYGNLQYMQRELLKAIECSDQKRKFFLFELGILYEKNGQYSEASILFDKFIEETDDNKMKEIILLYKFENEHNETNANVTWILEKLKESDDEFIQFQVKYWEIHINIESGIINLDCFNELLDELNHNDWENEFNYSHIVRRIYSDYSRTYYMIGNIDYDRFEFVKSKMGNIIEDTPEFEAYKLLAYKANYYHYDVVYQLGIWGYCKYYCGDEDYNLEQLLIETKQYYEQSIELFKVINNKTSKTTDIRMQEILMLQEYPNFAKIKQVLRNFRTESYNNKISVYVAYANCILFKLEVIEHFSVNSKVKVDVWYEKCLSILRKAQRIYDEERNKFGTFRSDFLQIMLELLKVSYEKRNPFDPLQDLAKLNKNNECYIREKELSDYICSLEKEKITSELIVTIIKYYPIILQ